MNEPKFDYIKFATFIIVLFAFVILSGYVISLKRFPSLVGLTSSSTDNGLSSASSTNIFASADQTGNVLNGQSYATTSIFAPKGIIQADIADDPNKRKVGLSYRTSLADDTGMLFIFPTPGLYDFWMKDMNFSLDIVWIKTDKSVAGVVANISPNTFPKTFDPPVEIQFVLELNAGVAEKLSIATGTTLKF